jgi:DNA-binding NtrC family response regulator
MLDRATRVYVVDDNLSIRNLVALTLRMDGYEVQEFGSGVSAAMQAVLEYQPIDILVTDIEMPEMNGVKLAEEMALKWSKIKVLFMSGEVKLSDLPGRIRFSDTKFIEEPFFRVDLLNAVAELARPVLNE